MLRITQDELKQVLRYEPETWEFWWMQSGPKRVTSTPAGNIHKGTGYRVINVNGVRNYAHRLAWLYVHGEWPDITDHINHDGLDNRITNLRSGTQKQNKENMRGPQKNNTSGFLGVTKKKDGRWVAQMGHHGKVIRIGQFETPQEAYGAYVERKRQLHTFSLL